MATFKAKAGKMVRTPKGVLTFRDETLEHDDKDVIEALRKAKGVEEVKAKSEPKAEKPDKKAK